MRWFKKKLTIKDLLDIDPGRINRSKNLKVKLVEEFNIVKEENWIGKAIRFLMGKSVLYFYRVFKYEVNSDSGNKYVVLIRVSPSFDVNKFLSNEVQVFCTCPDFKYRGAYELNKVGSLYLNNATQTHLGEALKIAPTKVVTTPLCKHLYACIIEFRKEVPKLIVKSAR